MNAVQEKLSSFILKRTLEKKQKDAQALLLGAFSQQDKGTLTLVKIEGLVTKILPFIIPKHGDEVKKAILKFGMDALKSNKPKNVTKTVKVAKKATKTTTKKPVKKVTKADTAKKSVKKVAKAVATNTAKKTVKKINSSW